MTLIVETGWGLADANAYASVDQVESELDAIGDIPEAWVHATVQQREDAIRAATSAIDQRYEPRFLGCRTFHNQALEWPRSVEFEDGLEIGATQIPTQLVRATAIAASLEIVSPGSFARPETRVVTSETFSLGPLSVSENYTGASTSVADQQKVDHAIARLLYRRGYLPRG